MNIVFILVLLFFLGSFMGWVLEFFFRRYFAPERKWCNPGFLAGPCLPIYGFGTCVLFLLSEAEQSIPIASLFFRRLILFLIMAVCMTLIEYIAGLIFVKGLKTRLWDYSEEKFNIQGIICLRFSLMWAFLGAAYYVLIHPALVGLVHWYKNNPEFTFVLGIAFGIFSVDLVYSFNVVAKIRAFAKENDILVRYEELKANIRKTALEHKEKYKFLFALKPDIPIKEHLNRYLEMIRSFDVQDILPEKNSVSKKNKETGNSHNPQGDALHISGKNGNASDKETKSESNNDSQNRTSDDTQNDK